MSIALLMAMASCSSSDDEVAEIKEESKLVPMTFTATQESNAGTRAALNGSNGVDWQTNDKISVFDGQSNQEVTLTDNVVEGKFSGTASSTATKFTAVYPYTDGAQLESDGSVSGITLPAEQTATLNSFDPKAALMMAYSTNKNQLDFKNAVSLVKVTTQFACKKIVLSSDIDIAGTGTLTMTFNNANDTYTSSFTFSSGNSKTITLKPAAGNTNIAAGTYYIAIRPHVSSGFSIRFINSNDTKAYTRTSTKSNTFNRSKIKNLGTFKESGTWTSTIDENGNVKASQQVDMGVFNIGGTNYRLIFTKSNLKKDGFLAENESDFGDYFAWAAPEPWLTSYTYDGSGTTDASFTNKIWKTGYTDGYKTANAPFYNSTSRDYTKYTSDGVVLDKSDDAANVILGGDWKIPTQAIWDALVNNSTQKNWIEDRKGYEFGNNNQTLFLPAAGKVDLTSFESVGSSGYYWSGTVYVHTSYGPRYAYYLGFGSDYVNAQKDYGRPIGFSVRPVRLVEE